MFECHIQITLTDKSKSEKVSTGFGGRYNIDSVTNQSWMHIVDKLIDRAMVNLGAVNVKAGQMPVILGSGWPGILIHESIGHGLEADFIIRKSSVYTDKVGEKICSDIVSVVDDGTIANRRGSLNFDDEGNETKRTTLIENGVLKNYMHSKQTAHIMGVEPTGNGRRESYAYMPMPRMTNTIMLPGTSSESDIISTTDEGIYAVNFSGGQVDISSGKFVFVMDEAYKIKNGKLVKQ